MDGFELVGPSADASAMKTSRPTALPGLTVAGLIGAFVCSPSALTGPELIVVVLLGLAVVAAGLLAHKMTTEAQGRPQDSRDRLLLDLARETGRLDDVLAILWQSTRESPSSEPGVIPRNHLTGDGSVAAREGGRSRRSDAARQQRAGSPRRRNGSDPPSGRVSRR